MASLIRLPPIHTFEDMVEEVSGARVVRTARGVVLSLVVLSTVLAVAVDGIGPFVAAPFTVVAIIIGLVAETERATNDKRVARLRGPIESVIWLWRDTSESPFGKHSVLVIGYTDGHRDRIALATGTDLREALLQRFPQARAGYSEARERTFEESPASFLSRTSADAPISEGSW